MNLTVSVKNRPGSSVPVSNVPSYISFREFRELLKSANVPLDEGRRWSEVEFYLNANDRDSLALADEITLSEAGLKSGSTLYMSYLESTAF